MPTKKTIQRARKAEREGKSPSTQAGEFVREEVHHVREGKHGARSPQQAIAIGLSKARRAGVDLPPPKRASRATQEQAARDAERGDHPRRKTSKKRARAASTALKRERRSSTSRSALSSQARKAAARRGAAARSKAAKRAARTKGPKARSAAARKAARTRARKKS